MDANLKALIDKTDFDNLFQKMGYKYFKNGDYNINVIGIRNLLNGNIQTDQFNDAIVYTYKVNGVWHRVVCDFTTDPGLKLLRAPSNSKGTAILVPGQYCGVYKLDMHNGKYQALCQRLGTVKVYRDNNRDNKLDFDDSTIDEGNFGINIHRASAYSISEVVGGYSAGCQVYKSYKDYDTFMSIVRKSANIFGNSFTYTLITTDQIKDPSIKYGVKKQTVVTPKTQPVTEPKVTTAQSITEPKLTTTAAPKTAALKVTTAQSITEPKPTTTAVPKVATQPTTEAKTVK